MKTLLKNGVVVDGSGSNRYQADVLIDGDKIVKIGKIDAADGAEVIDVTGLVVALDSLIRTATVISRFLLILKFVLRSCRESRRKSWGKMESPWLHCRKNISVLGERTWLVLMVTPIR